MIYLQVVAGLMVLLLGMVWTLLQVGYIRVRGVCTTCGGEGHWHWIGLRCQRCRKLWPWAR